MTARVDRDLIRRFYREQTPTRKPRLQTDLRGFTACTRHTGLGDTLMLSALPRAAAQAGQAVSLFAPGPSFATLCAHNPFYRPQVDTFCALTDRLLHGYNLGGGHFIQRLERAWRLPVDLLPRPCLVLPRITRDGRRVVFHFGPGGEQNLRAQRRLIHPRAREIYPPVREALQQFVDGHPELSFAEVGDIFSRLRGVDDWTGLPLDQTIARMAGCEYFIGINSGPMHLAAALDLKIIAIINFPPAQLLVLPVIHDVELFDVEWLYPQSVILHQDAEGPLVPRFSLNNLERAVAGEIYPYWSSGYLDLIDEGDVQGELDERRTSVPSPGCTG
jgi:hypothetical protein